ncbi:GNAT family N-acetyltransferase [Flavobacterium panacagri]|nr:N-acetyltransferase [Flavobacterium panacagri]
METFVTMEIKDNTFARQFETVVPEGMLAVEYSFQEKKIFLTKINTPDSYQNDDAINALLKNVLDLSSEKNYRVVPIHPKIVSFFKKNPKYKELLPPGIRI